MYFDDLIEVTLIIRVWRGETHPNESGLFFLQHTLIYSRIFEARSPARQNFAIAC